MAPPQETTYTPPKSTPTPAAGSDGPEGGQLPADEQCAHVDDHHPSGQRVHDGDDSSRTAPARPSPPTSNADGTVTTVTVNPDGTTTTVTVADKRRQRHLGRG